MYNAHATSPNRSSTHHHHHRGTKNSPNKGSAAAPQTITWNKSHKLEGDCLITGFYDFLLLRNNETMKPCVDVLIPDTIVYDHNFPRGWYTTDTDKSREVMKRQGTDLDSSKVLEFFSKAPSKSCGIVASYMSSYEEDDVTTTSVEFFNANTLKEFVERKQKREGILQRFIIPKGGTRNTVIQAVWSPNPNAFFVWRRTNRMHLDHKPQWERDPYPMCVTYDGPSHYSEEGTCALEVKKAIRKVCETIVEHFFQVYEKEKVITRLVLYFKLDEQDQLWLLWCGGLRVADANSAQLEAAHHTVPLNLAPKYTDSSKEAQRESHEWELLDETNKKYMELRKSAAAGKHNNSSHPHGTSPRGGGKDGSHSPGSPGSLNNTRGSPGNTVGSGYTGSPTSGKGGASSGYDDGDDHHHHTSGTSGSGGAGGSGGDGSSKTDESWHKNAQIHDAYVELCTARDVVINYLEDIFYEAYGHFLRYDPGSFTFEVDKKIAGLLGNDPLGEAMAAGGVQKATPSETGMTSIDDEDLCFEIPPKHPNGPVSKIGDAVKKWVNNHYDKLILDLKEEAASILPPITSMGAAGAGGGASSSATSGGPIRSGAGAASSSSKPAAGGSSSPAGVVRAAGGSSSSPTSPAEQSKKDTDGAETKKSDDFELGSEEL